MTMQITFVRGKALVSKINYTLSGFSCCPFQGSVDVASLFVVAPIVLWGGGCHSFVVQYLVSVSVLVLQVYRWGRDTKFCGI